MKRWCFEMQIKQISEIKFNTDCFGSNALHLTLVLGIFKSVEILCFSCSTEKILLSAWYNMLHWFNALFNNCMCCKILWGNLGNHLFINLSLNAHTIKKTNGPNTILSWPNVKKKNSSENLLELGNQKRCKFFKK